MKGKHRSEWIFCRFHIGEKILFNATINSSSTTEKEVTIINKFPPADGTTTPVYDVYSEQTGELWQQVGEEQLRQRESAITCSCVPGRSYNPRGPLQLTGNYNYGTMGVKLRQYLSNNYPSNYDTLDLLKNPGLVSEDPVIAFAAAIYHWMTPNVFEKKPSSHSVMTTQWKPSKKDVAANRVPGFGLTTNIINGKAECGRAGDSRVQARVEYYLRFCKIMGIEPGSSETLYCDKQTHFALDVQELYGTTSAPLDTTSGSNSIIIYWSVVTMVGFILL